MASYFQFSIGSSQLLNFVIANFSLGSILFLIGIFVLSRNFKNPLNQIFAIYSFSIAWWSLFTILLITSRNAQAGYFWDQVCLSGAVFIPTTFFHFVLVFLRIAKKYIPCIFACYLISILFFALNWIGFFVKEVQPNNVFNFYTVPSLVYTCFVSYFSFLSAISVFLLFRVIRQGSEKPRFLKQIKWLFWASCFGYIGGGTNFLLVYGIYVPFFTPLANYAILVYGIAVAYIILKYKFLDIEVIVKKTLVFAGLLGMAMVVIAIVMEISNGLITKLVLVPALVERGLSILIAFLLYEPTKKFLVRITDRYLFQKKEDVRVVLNRLAQSIITILDIEKAGTTILETLKDSLRLESGVILIQDEDGKSYEIMDCFGVSKKRERFPKDGLFIRYFLESDKILSLEDQRQRDSLPPMLRGPLDSWGAVICIPLFIHRELIGLLVLGKKKSDQEFSDDELECFPVVAGQVAIALSNARLYETLKKSQIDFAQQAKMAAIGTLSAGISHEIKNPLNHIRVGIGMLKLNKKHGVYANFNKEQFEDEVFKTLEIFEENVVRANSVIERLSSFAKKPKELKIESVNLKRVVETGLNFLQNEFEQYGIEVEKIFPENLPLVQADQHTLEDVFLNLLVNARHAIEQKGKITVKGYVQNEELFIDIQDTGKGIPPENQEKIFDPFFTTKDVSRNPDKEAIKGSGLGLFIVREFVQRFGGHILLDSEVGKGTTFHIVFPASTWVKIGDPAHG